MSKVLINGVLTLCQGGRGGATKDDIIAELKRRKLEYNKSALKDVLCKILADDDKKSSKVEKKAPSSPRQKPPSSTRQKAPSSPKEKLPKLREKKEESLIPLGLSLALNGIFDSTEKLVTFRADEHSEWDINGKVVLSTTKNVDDLSDELSLIYSEVIPNDRILEVYKLSQNAFGNILEDYQKAQASGNPELIKEKKSKIRIGSIAIYDINRKQYIAETGAFLRREWMREDQDDWWREYITAVKYISRDQVFYLTNRKFGSIIWDFSKNTLERIRTKDDMDTRSIMLHPLDSRVLVYIKLSKVRFVFLDHVYEEEKEGKESILITDSKVALGMGNADKIIADHLIPITGNAALYIGAGVGLFKFVGTPSVNMKTEKMTVEVKYTNIIGNYEGRGEFGPVRTPAGMIKEYGIDLFTNAYEITSMYYLLKTTKRYMFMLDLDNKKLYPITSTKGYIANQDSEYLVANLPKYHLIAYYNFSLVEHRKKILLISYSQLLNTEKDVIDITQLAGELAPVKYPEDMLTVSHREPFLEAKKIILKYIIDKRYLSMNLTRIIDIFL